MIKEKPLVMSKAIKIMIIDEIMINRKIEHDHHNKLVNSELAELFCAS